MSYWKPERGRESLIDFGISFYCGQSLDSVLSIGGAAHSHVNVVVSAILVGLGDRMLDLAPRAIEWIDLAIARGETMGPDRLAWYGLLTEAKAVAQWLISGENPAATWGVAFDERLAALKRHADVPLRGRRLHDWMDDTLACAYQAGRFEEAVALHDAMLTSKPATVRRIRTPRQLAYALCLRGLGRSQASDAELIEAGHRVLRGHLAEVWLHNGQYECAAVWLKIVHELANPGLPPAQVLLKAYDDMPTIPRPSFLPA